MMQEAKSTNARASPTATNDKEETKKLKLEIKAKPQTLKVLSDQKSELANEIRDLQEKANNGQNKDVFEKCIKLTTEVNSRKTENKDLEKENKKLIETLSELQTKMNESNNKLAEAQVSSIRLKEFNAQMFELCKGNKIMEKLEKEHANDINEQKVVFEGKKATETKAGSSKDSLLSNPKNKPVEKKCWHYENGFCKKGTPCNWIHPIEICRYFSKYGQCPQGLVCALRHPLRICMKYMEGGCNMGDMCVLQHPINTTPPRPSMSSPPHPGFSLHSQPRATFNNLPNLPYPQPTFQFPLHVAQLGSQFPMHPFGNPATLPTRYQTPPQPTFNQNNSGYQHHGSPSASANGNTQQQQGFW